MEITRETDYAIRCVLYLLEKSDRVANVQEIAKAKAIPKSFLSKILQKLTKAGIAESCRGAKGGFKIVRGPEEINLLDIIEAIEGPVSMNRCAVNNKVCGLSRICSVHPVWIKLRKNIEDNLKRIKFGELIKSQKTKKNFLIRKRTDSVRY